MLSREELAAWLRLAETPGLGRATARRLLAAFGAPEAVLGAGEAALREFVDAPLVAALLARDARHDALVETTWRWLGAAEPASPRTIVALGDARYPPLLLETADPPLLLHAIGRVELLSAPGVAVVGSRSATPQGLDNARAFARHLSERRLTIVSGLALGVDGAAHEGGLAGPGSTVAFVGTGLDQVYPARHAALARRISEHGLMASEFALGMPPLAANFPRRNRLIAGLSQGTLVVEAAVQSGSLITARMALESGREVFAIPGSIHSPQARGCHRLIQQGAKLVETADDILQELRLPSGNAPSGAPARSPGDDQAALFAPAPAPERAPVHAFTIASETVETSEADGDGPLESALLRALGHDPVTFDALSARTGMPSDRLAADLLGLELAGSVQRLPGGLFQRRGSA